MLNKKKILISVILIFCFGRLIKKNYQLFNELVYLSSQKYFTHELTSKAKNFNDQMEVAPFIWQDKLYYLVTSRVNTDEKELQIRDYETHKKILSFGKGYGLASIYANEENIYVVATHDWHNWGKSVISLFKLNGLTLDDVEKTVVLKAGKDEKLFNTSLAFNRETNEYILSYEIDKSGLTHFSLGFLKSRDLKSWESTGSIFSPKLYAACPKITFHAGYYYLWYLGTAKNRHLVYQKRIARSKDLDTWEKSPYMFLSPSEGEGVNTSDFDYISWKGKSYLFYADGDQNTWTSVNHVMWKGRLEDSLELYFTDSEEHRKKGIKYRDNTPLIKYTLQKHFKFF